MKVHNFFGPNIVTSFLVEVVIVIVINVAHATASASTEATSLRQNLFFVLDGFQKIQ